MTPLDWQVYTFVLRYTARHHYPPESVGMIARALGRWHANVWQSVERMRQLGIMERERGRMAAPVLLTGKLP